MANSDLPGLTEDVNPASDSLVYTVDDPAGTPVNRKVTFSNFIKGLIVNSLTSKATPAGTDPVMIGDTAASNVAKRTTAQALADIAKPTESFGIAASDEVTALTVGVNKAVFRMPYAFTLSSVRASVTVAPTGSVLTVDVNEDGLSILSTKLTIDATEKTSITAATPVVISDASLAEDAEISVDIDGVGSTIAGAGLKVFLIGKRT